MSLCPRCGASFECGMADPGATEPCWCMQLPKLPVEVYMPDRKEIAASRCFCPYCLRALQEARKAVSTGKP
jgi:hypothetical protein